MGGAQVFLLRVYKLSCDNCLQVVSAGFSAQAPQKRENFLENSKGNKTPFPFVIQVSWLSWSFR